MTIITTKVIGQLLDTS